MSEPGMGEGSSLDPIKEELKTARRQLVEGNIERAKRAERTIAKALSRQIETGNSSDDPDAYILRRVTLEDDFITMGKRIRYILTRPDSLADNFFAVSIGLTDDEERTDITLADSDVMDLYASYGFAGASYSLNTQRKELGKVEIFDELKTVYSEISEHGVRIDPELVVVKDVSYSTNNKLLQQLPFTEKLRPSSPKSVQRQKEQQIIPKGKKFGATPPDKSLDAFAYERKVEERDAAEKLAAAEDKKQAELQRKEEEGHGFEDGLKKYAMKRNKERKEIAEGQLEQSYIDSIQQLMWDYKDGEIIPGKIFSEEMRPTLERLTGTSRIIQRLEERPRMILEIIERDLSEKFLRIERDTETGKEIIRAQPEYEPGKFEREGELVTPYDLFSGSIQRGNRTSRAQDGSLFIRPDQNTTFTDLTVTLAPDLPVDAELLDKDGKSTGTSIEAKPILRARLTQNVKGEEEKKTTLYRTRYGLVVVGDRETKCYPDDLSYKMSISL